MISKTKMNGNFTVFSFKSNTDEIRFLHREISTIVFIYSLISMTIRHLISQLKSNEQS